MKSSALGKWRIVQMEQWDQDFVDLVSPGHVTFHKGGTGQLHFGAVDLDVDWRFDAETGRAEFSFTGFDEGDEVSGRGWAKNDAGQLIGRIVFQQGDDSGFTAKKAT